MTPGFLCSGNLTEMAPNEVFITGIGQSQVGVRSTRHPLLLTLDAVREALDESGLTLADIDGVSTYPGKAAVPPGFSPIGATDLIDALHMDVRWYNGGFEITSQLGALGAAAGAIRAGP